MKHAWMDLSGLAIVRDRVHFETVTTEEYDRILREEWSVSEPNIII